MFDMRLDKSNFTEKSYCIEDIKILDEITLIHAICEMLYENHANFLFYDENDSDFGMDCKFDLPCLLDNFEQIMDGLQRNKDFEIEFFEPGREYYLSFANDEGVMTVSLRIGYDEKRVRKYVTESAIVKEILVNLFKDIFIIAERNINNIRENPVFNGWVNILGLSF